MTLLDDQAEIKARKKVVRDRSGQYRQPDVALALQLAAERMRERLLRDVKAMEHARGVVWEEGHFHKLPGFVAPPPNEPAFLPETLFDRMAA